MISTKWRRPIRKLLKVFAWLLLVVAVFTAGVGIYMAASAYWSLLLDWWRELLAGLVAVIALGAWWLWWRLPKHQADGLPTPDPKERADLEDNIRKTVGQLLGGAAVLTGAAFAYLQFTQQQETARQQIISNQVSKGFEQLASEKVSMRLGGIYALEGVMNTSKEYHQPVLEGLCAFVRDGTRTKEASAGAPAAENPLNPAVKPLPLTRDEVEALLAKLKPPATDVQAALTVIGRRVAGTDIKRDRIDLTHAHIPKADLRGADLRGANLIGTNLTNASLDGADLLVADLNGAELSHAFLNDANLGSAILVGANLSGTNLSSANLYSADLRGASPIEANLTYANLINANLRGTDLFHANLSGADLQGANLINANLSDANLINADLRIARLNGARLNGADLTGARGLTREQLESACGENVKGLDELSPPLDRTPTIKPCPQPADK